MCSLNLFVYTSVLCHYFSFVMCCRSKNNPDLSTLSLAFFSNILDLFRPMKSAVTASVGITGSSSSSTAQHRTSARPIHGAVTVSYLVYHAPAPAHQYLGRLGAVLGHLDALQWLRCGCEGRTGRRELGPLCQPRLLGSVFVSTSAMEEPRAVPSAGRVIGQAHGAPESP